MLGIRVFMMRKGGRLELTGARAEVDKVRKKIRTQVEDIWVTAARD